MRARTRADGTFWNAQNGMKRALLWSILNFDARARARRDAHADMDCQYVGQWPEVYVFWILSIYEDMNDNVKSKMAPSWRHGWVIKLTKSHHDKDTVKIWRWLLIFILSYPLNKIRGKK